MATSPSIQARRSPDPFAPAPSPSVVSWTETSTAHHGSSCSRAEFSTAISRRVPLPWPVVHACEETSPSAGGMKRRSLRSQDSEWSLTSHREHDERWRAGKGAPLSALQSDDSAERHDLSCL